MFRKSIAFTLIIITALSIVPISAGGSIADLQYKQQQIENKINEIRKQADALKGEKMSAQQEIDALDSEIRALSFETDNYELQKQEINMKIAESEQKIEELTTEIDNNNETLEERLRVMYKNGTAGYMEVILNSDNLVDALTRV
ncbi:MAG: hypothetical protein ACERLG_12785, partial [Sedimentibacter sp.]